MKKLVINSITLCCIISQSFNHLSAQECKESITDPQRGLISFSMKIIETPHGNGEPGLKSVILEKKIYSQLGAVPASQLKLGDTRDDGFFKDGDGLTADDVVKIWDMDMNEIDVQQSTQQEDYMKVETTYEFPDWIPGELKIIKFTFTGGKDANGNDKGICAYKINIRDEWIRKTYEVKGVWPDYDDEDNYYSWNNAEYSGDFELDCDKVQACIGPKLDEEAIGESVSYSEDFGIILPPFADYYEVEMVIEGNGMTQNANIGYVWSPACTISVCTTATCTIPQSEYYLWNGYYKAYPRARASSTGIWERGPASWFYYNYYGSRQQRVGKGDIQQVESRIYPNPSDNEGFNLEVSGLKETENSIVINVYDLLGKEVYSEQMNFAGADQLFKLNTNASLESGFYLLNIQVNRQFFVEKIQIK